VVSNLIRYSYVATRARGMFANFLKAEEYQQLLKAQDLAEFEKVLRKVYPAGGVVGTGRQAALDAPALEDKVRDHFLDIAGKIRRSLPEIEQAFLDTIRAEYEIYNIKALLRGRILGSSTEDIRKWNIPLGDFALLDWEELLAEDEIPEIMNMLRAHPLGAKIDRAYRERYLKGHSLYRMDSQIDVDYLSWLYDATAMIRGQGARPLKELVGLRLDTINISWILRFKENFKMAPEEIMVELIPRGHYLDVKSLKPLVFEQDPKRLLALLRHYPWGAMLPSQKLELAKVEAGLERFLKERYYKMFRASGMRFAGVVAFVLLVQAMAQDTIKILGATEYHLNRDSVRSKLFFVNKMVGAS
jgi:V/A-type H+/Na+-transporting ATPase subunit C